MLFYLLVLLGVATSVTVIYRARPHDREFASFIVFPVLVIGVLLTAIGSVINLTCAKPQVIAHRVYPIASLKSVESLSGRFFLGSGGFGSSESYYFMFDLGDGAFSRGSVSATSTIIQEDDAHRPSLAYDVIRTTCATRWWPEWATACSEYEGTHTLTVPTGTVTQRFSVQ
jgi:hypothetical protein